MPKKHRQKFLTSPSSNISNSASSSSLASNIPAVGSKGHTSVNDLLAHLRISQPRIDTPRLPISTLRSVPPSLQQILANADSPPPIRPRVQIGVPRRNRIPGPPPPASWLGADTTEKGAEEEAIYKAEYRAEDVCKLPDLAHIESDRLAHAVLAAIARDWSFHMVYDQHYLYTLRPGLKSALLAYIAAYNQHGVGADGLWVLFKDDPDDDNSCRDRKEGWEAEAELSGDEDFKHMDLTRALGPRLTWKDLSGLFHSPLPPPVQRPIESYLGELWHPSSTPPRSRFPSLTHLSLSYPHATMSSWTRLTAFARLTPTVTHLSLAGWPLSTSADPAGVLKRFARSLLCLKWLDVSDCNAAFYKALKDVEWDRCWRGVETVVCRQAGKSPKGIREERVRAAEELKMSIRAIRQEVRGKWCGIVV